MSLQVLLGENDITNRVISAKVYKKLSTSKGINPNEAIITIDNSDNYYTADALPDENTLLEIYYDGVQHFKGYIYRPKLSIKSARMTINARDYWKIIEKRTLPNVVYIDQRFLDVLKDLITRGGESESNLVADDPDITIPFLHFEKGTKVTEAIKELLKSVDGFMWYSGDGVLNFRSVFARQTYSGTYQTINIVGELNTSLFDNLVFRKLPPECNIATVEIDTKTVSYDKEVVYFGATTDKPFNVPANGYPEDPDDHFYIDFDEPVWWIEQYNEIEVASSSGDIYVDQGVYESNFLDNTANPGVLKNPWKIELRIVNNSGSDGQITRFIIEGKKVDTAHFVASSGSGIPEEEYKIRTDVIGDKDWAKRLADWLLEVKGEKWEIENIKIVDFDKHDVFDLGDKVTVKYDDLNIDENALIDEVTLDFDTSTITLAVKQLKGETYTYPGGVGGTEEGPGIPGAEGDGEAPPAPASIAATPGIGLITVSWSSVSSQIYDFSYYELQRSVDGGAWEAIINTEGNSYVDKDVSYSSNYKYRVRAWDIEHKSSAYTEMTTAVSPVRAGTDDIDDETITANKLSVAVDLSVGRKIQVGSDIELGNEVLDGVYSGFYAGDGENGALLTSDGLKKVVDKKLLDVSSIIYSDVLNFDGSKMRQRITLPFKVPIDRLRIFTSFNSMQTLMEHVYAYTSYDIIPDSSNPELTQYIDIISAQAVGYKKNVGSFLYQYNRYNPGAITVKSASLAELNITFKARHEPGNWLERADKIYTKNVRITHNYPAIADYSLTFSLDSYSIVQNTKFGHTHEQTFYWRYTVDWGDGTSVTKSASKWEGKIWSNYVNPQPSGWPQANVIVSIMYVNGNPKPVKSYVNVLVFLE